MTDEQINIAIAEACGYKDVTTRITEGTFKVITGFKNHNFDEEIPDYTSDLNAMHEAMLLHPRKDLLRKFLYLEVLEDPKNTTNEPAWATAKQWAIAYVKSFGKWEE
jgi:hypothetical protein